MQRNDPRRELAGLERGWADCGSLRLSSALVLELHDVDDADALPLAMALEDGEFVLIHVHGDRLIVSVGPVEDDDE